MLRSQEFEAAPSDRHCWYQKIICDTRGEEKQKRVRDKTANY